MGKRLHPVDAGIAARKVLISTAVAFYEERAVTPVDRILAALRLMRIGIVNAGLESLGELSFNFHEKDKPEETHNLRLVPLDYNPKRAATPYDGGKLQAMADVLADSLERADIAVISPDDSVKAGLWLLFHHIKDTDQREFFLTWDNGATQAKAVVMLNHKGDLSTADLESD